MLRFTLTVLLFLPLAPVRTDRAKDQPSDADKLQGTWQVVAFETPEAKLTPDQLRDYAKLTIKGSEYTWSTGGKGSFKLDPVKNPKAVDYLAGPADANPPVRAAIYEFIDADTFRDCMAPAGMPRPTEFSTPPGSGQLLLVYRRVRD